ncbi:MAG: hypothetical protein M1438_13665 [Deltaproteobacteria bacterium]|nr:hypothetical protein [Deltaproteobacteria bacterium]
MRLLSPCEPEIVLDAVIAKWLWAISPQEIGNILLDTHFEPLKPKFIARKEKSPLPPFFKGGF